MEDTDTKGIVIEKMEWEGWLFYGIGLATEFLAGSDHIPMAQPFVRGGIVRTEIDVFFRALDVTSKKNLQVAVASILRTLPVCNRSMGPILDLLAIARHFEAIEILPILQSHIIECELNNIKGGAERELLCDSIMTTVLALARPGDACVHTCINAFKESDCYTTKLGGQIDAILAYVASATKS